MNTSSFNVTAGAMTYWSLGQQTDPSILQTGLSQLGLPNYVPKAHDVSVLLPDEWLNSHPDDRRQWSR